MKDQLDLPKLFEMANDILANEPNKTEIMTPKEKAEQLVDRFVKLTYSVNKFNYITELECEVSKQCALICVDEILKALYEVEYWEKDSAIKICKHYKEVKQEINKL
jgi:hypothetical protein